MSRCGVCSAVIEGVSTVAPGVHELRPCRHPASHEHRTQAAEPLVPDGGQVEHDRPAFIGPQTEWVECYHCGRIITDFSRVEGLDISSDDEYYPKMVPVCRDGNHRDPHHGTNRGALRPDGGRATCPDREQTRRHLLYILVLVLWNTLLTAAVVGGLLT